MNRRNIRRGRRADALEDVAGDEDAVALPGEELCEERSVLEPGHEMGPPHAAQDGARRLAKVQLELAVMAVDGGSL